MKPLPLRAGIVALVDDDDYAELSKYKWSIVGSSSSTLYVGRVVNKELIALHRYLLQVSDNKQVDHIDGNGLNNQRVNLRVATKLQNSYNRKLNSNSTSGYKGVSYATNVRKWQAKIAANGKRKSLGYYATPEDAALAYNEAAKALHGEFARLNLV